MFGNRFLPTAAVALALAPFAAPLQGGAIIMSAVGSGMLLTAELNMLIREQVIDANRMVRINKAKDLLAKARKDYAAAITELNQEIKRLEVNPERNRDEITRLRGINQDAGEAHRRLTFLSSLTEADTAGKSNFWAALKSPYFKRTLEQLESLNKRLGGAKEKTAQAIASGGSDVIGSVELISLEVYRGELSLSVMEDLPGGGRVETPLGPGGGVAVRRLPIALRASIRDENKKRLIAAPAKAVTLEFFEPSDGLPDQVFRYSGTAGQSTWTTSETYKWEPETKDRHTRERLRGFATRNSSRYARGDIAEIHPAAGTVQNLVFYVDARCENWHRQSELGGRRVDQDVVPKNNTAAARVVISIFPR